MAFKKAHQNFHFILMECFCKHTEILNGKQNVV